MSEQNYNYKLDKKISELVIILNSLPGIDVCCRSDLKYDNSVKLWFYSTDSNGLFIISRCIDRRYWEYGNEWTVELEVGDIMNNGNLPIAYYMYSHEYGDVLIKQIDSLLNNISRHIHNKYFIDAYNLDKSLFNKYLNIKQEYRKQKLIKLINNENIRTRMG